MNLGHWAAVAAVKAAMNSASVEPDAVTVWVLLSHAVAPPKKVNACPVIDLCFLSSEPQPASTKPISLGCEMSTLNSPIHLGAEQAPDDLNQTGHSKTCRLVCRT